MKPNTKKTTEQRHRCTLTRVLFIMADDDDEYAHWAKKDFDDVDIVVPSVHYPFRAKVFQTEYVGGDTACEADEYAVHDNVTFPTARGADAAVKALERDGWDIDPR